MAESKTAEGSGGTGGTGGNGGAPGPGEAPDLVVVEVGDGSNNNVLFGPRQERLRGRWDPHNLHLGDTSAVGLMQMPAIPGLHLRVSLRERRLEVVDPLASPEATAQLAAISAAHHNLFKKDVTPLPHVAVSEPTDDDIATWLFWIMRMVKSGMARVVSGALPRDEAALRKLMPRAKVRKDFYTSTRSHHTEDD